MKKQNQELKTLKDLDFVKGCEKGRSCADELKAEAIKWVKSKDILDYNGDIEYWITEFFNITEEDLK